MFERILNLFSPAPSQTALPERDMPHALGALLVRAAKADKAYLFEEVEQIDLILADMNGLNPVEAAKFRAECERLEEEIPDTADLAAILHDAIPMAEREACVTALWRVVFADGIEHKEEDELLHAVEATLGVSPDAAKRLHEMAQAAAHPGV